MAQCGDLTYIPFKYLPFHHTHTHRLYCCAGVKNRPITAQIDALDPSFARKDRVQVWFDM